jgi:intergrase/recombinase
MAAGPHGGRRLPAFGMHIQSTTKTNQRMLVKAGLPQVSLHGYRRPFATMAQWVEVPDGVVKQIIGHKANGVTEKHYTRRSVDMLRMWHGRIDAWVLAQAEVRFTADPESLKLVA